MRDANESMGDLAPAALEASLARHPRRVLVALAGAAVFVRLVLCLQVAGTPLVRVDALVRDSDNAFFDRWGARVADGDLLQREPFHPTAGWMRSVADGALSADPLLPVRLGLAKDPAYDRAAMQEKLWDRWLGGATFFQEPGYPYLVGLTYALAGRGVWHVFAWQLALGVLGVLVVWQLARRLFSETAGAAAGLLAILAPIPLVYEVALLRDALVAVLTVALALAMHWAPGGRRRRWLALGLAFGAAALVKQSFLFFPPLLAAWRLATVRAPVRARAAAAGLVVAGLALALLPAAARNVLVGVPPLALNGSAAGMLALFHTATASPVLFTIPPEFTHVLVAADGRPLASLVEAARTHADAWSFAALELKKLLYAWHGYESPNNVDAYLFRQGAPIVAALPATFVVLLPLAAAGLASRRAAARAWPLVVAILASVPTMILATVLSRYRAAVTVALLPLAGAGVVQLWAWAAARRWRPLAAAGALAAAYVAWATAAPPGREPEQRAAEYAGIGVQWVRGGEPAYAVLHFQEALRLTPGDAQMEAWLARALVAAGEARAALPHLETAARSLDSPAFLELHAVALAEAGLRDAALAKARAALRADPRREGALGVVRALGGGAGPAGESGEGGEAGRSR